MSSGGGWGVVEWVCLWVWGLRGTQGQFGGGKRIEKGNNGKTNNEGRFIGRAESREWGGKMENV